MKLLNKLFFTTFFRVVIGLVFIIGALLKLYPIEPFEVLFVKLNLANWFLSSFFARFLIGFELIIGALLIFNLYLKKTLYLSAVTLIGFTLFLIYFKFIYGSNDNCGCFGSMIHMNPIESIIKNIVLLIIVFLLLKKSDFYHWDWKKFKLFLLIFTIIAGIAFPFILNTVDFYDNEGHYVIEPGMNIHKKGLESVKFQDNTIDLTKGKKVVCFYSLECTACKLSAIKMSAIQIQSNNTFPIYIVFLDNQKKDLLLPKFIEETDTKNIPYTIFDSKRFFKVSSKNIPFIMFLEDGEIKNLNNLRDMDPNYVLEFLTGN